MASSTLCIRTCCMNVCRRRGACNCTGGLGSAERKSYGERAREIAAELAMHFERGRDYKRAAKYLQQAADNAIRRFAYQEAVEPRAPWDRVARAACRTRANALSEELCLHLTLGVPLIAIEGYAARMSAAST